MSDSKILTDVLMAMRHSPIPNYVVPGITSWLIGDTAAGGKMRMFESSRQQFEHVTPHSHRFDFKALVLSGEVVNTRWFEAGWPSIGDAGRYETSELIYGGNVGSYERVAKGDATWYTRSTTYKTGESYEMKADEIHSIVFSRGAKVLIIEGPTTTDRSKILEPIVDGRVIPTFKVEDWMFKSGTEKRDPGARRIDTTLLDFRCCRER